MATVETWGVDQTFVESFTAEHIKIADGVSAMITTGRLDVLIPNSAGRVNTIITGILGTGAVATLVANKTATQEGASVYATIQGCVMDHLWPHLLAAAHGLPPTADDIDDAEARIRLKVEDLRQHPEDLATPNIDVSQVATSTAALGIDTTTQRAAFDGWDNLSSGRRRKYW